MSRWSKRSQEEKERIAKEQKEKSIRVISVTSEGVKDDGQIEILKRHEIPLRCAAHGWMAPLMYILTMEVPMIFGGDPVLTISGDCPKCRSGIRRYIIPHLIGMDAMMVIPFILEDLKKQNRIIDRR